MSDKTGIEWTDATWNPLRGCSRVSEGCRHCYAEGVAKRFSGPGMPYEGLIARGGQWNGQIKLVPELLDQPLRWRRPRRIFVNSMSDLFHENVREDFIDQVFAIMALADRHTFQVLTKRPERMRDYCQRLQSRAGEIAQCAVMRWGGVDPDGLHDWVVERVEEGPLPNVWLGVSVEDQATADSRIPLLLKTPAAVRWISAEPLLGGVSLEKWIHQIPASPDPRTGHDGGPFSRIDWVVVGGESGREARPMHPDWARSLRDQCAAARVPFLFKQWGEWADTPHFYDRDQSISLLPDGAEYCVERKDEFEKVIVMRRVGKKSAGRHLDGVLHDGYPEVRHA